MSIAERIKEEMRAHADEGKTLRNMKQLVKVENVLRKYKDKYGIEYILKIKYIKEGYYLAVISFYIETEKDIEIILFNLRRIEDGFYDYK